MGKAARKKFFLSVGVLAGGTGLSQAIMLAMSPVLTRIYSPTDFSMLAAYTALTSILSVAACLRFDIAIPLPEAEHEAANLLGLSLFFAFAVAFVTMLIVATSPQSIAAVLRNPGIEPLLWLVPLGVFANAAYSAMQLWATRKKKFASIARIKLIQALGASGTQIGGGVLAPSPAWLLLGAAVNYGLGAVLLIKGLLVGGREVWRAISLPAMAAAFRNYSAFPKFSTLEAVANSSSILLPVLMISALAAAPEAGFLLLAMQAMQAPMGLIGTSISQVYFSSAAEEWKNGTLAESTISILGLLTRFGVGPIIFVCLLAPEIFSLVFGQSWHRSGVLVMWMGPWLVLQFLASPVSMALHVTGNQKAALVLQLSGLILRVGAVWITYRVAPSWIAEAYAMSGAVFYFFYLGIIVRTTGIGATQIAQELRRSAMILAMFVILAVLMRTTLALTGWLN
ncbi:oligosaccharide flippase family protein [Achromobacter xylosoxidans]|uniref:oligosaccharide flippase family protein n=1 Tax=Alcaligenes xylosoxydans xylosoxydans TaxID=85698 RepID=UPI0012DF84FF|nr:oligosaccharide flippase family protein [Achromobacter xylosoxidans]